MRIPRAALLYALAPWFVTSCLSPPIVLPGQGFDAKRAMALYPPGTEHATVQKPDGTSLRGSFVPAAADAPVVLHLLESGGSSASVLLPRHQVLWDLANLGLSSLVLDYTGVGLSDGEPKAKNLATDTLLMWEEALRRGGSPDRIIVRCESLGSIAFALLLDSGSHPKAAVVVNPVTTDGVIRRFARKHHGWLAAMFVPFVFKPVARVDVIDELVRFDGPLLVVASPDDELLSNGERSALRERHAFAEVFGEHIMASFQARMLHADEVRFFLANTEVESREAARTRLARGGVLDDFGEELDVERLLDAARAMRLESAPTVTAAAMCADDPVEAFRLVRVTRLWRKQLGFQECRALFSLEDPAGKLDLGVIEFTAAFYAALALVKARLRDGPKPEFWLAERIRRLEPGVKQTMIWKTRGRAWSVRASLSFSLDEDSALSARDQRRQIARSHLKALGIPDRVVEKEDGSYDLEFFSETWVPFPLDCRADTVPQLPAP